MNTENPYPTTQTRNKGTLPNPFIPPNGKPITTTADWPAAAQAWRNLIASSTQPLGTCLGQKFNFFGEVELPVSR